VKVGLVGCGRVTALRHLPALATLGEAQAVALADVDPQRLETLARAHGIERRYASHEDLLADDEVEAVAVCVPASLHADVAVASLEAGKHVLIEKPMTLNVGDALRISEAADHAPGVAMIGLNLRHHRLIRRARALVRGGALGEIHAVRTVFTSSFDYRDAAHPWRFRRETGGGAVAEMGPHHLDLWRFLTGREVEQVFASSRSDRDEDDTAVITGVLEGGAQAETLVSQRSTNVNEVEVFGELGRVRVSCYRYDGLEVQVGRGFGGDVRQRVAGLTRAAVELPAFVRGLRRGNDYVESYVAEWRGFVQAASGAAAADADLEDGLRNVRILAAALESLDSRRAVRLGEVAVTS
jgi:UDP-N-acetylglucosamine 3-dehydrogenase